MTFEVRLVFLDFIGDPAAVNRERFFCLLKIESKG